MQYFDTLYLVEPLAYFSLGESSIWWRKIEHNLLGFTSNLFWVSFIFLSGIVFFYDQVEFVLSSFFFTWLLIWGSERGIVEDWCCGELCQNWTFALESPRNQTITKVKKGRLNTNV